MGKSHVRKVSHRVLPEVIILDDSREQTIQEGHVTRGRGGIFGPVDDEGAVGVERVSELDQVVGQIASTVDVEDVGCVELIGSKQYQHRAVVKQKGRSNVQLRELGSSSTAC